MYLVELLMLENLNFAAKFIRLSAADHPNLWPCIDFSGHLGGHLGIFKMLNDASCALHIFDLVWSKNSNHQRTVIVV